MIETAQSLPHSQELERAYLVIPVLDPPLFKLAESLIPSLDVFYMERHQIIWQAQKAVIARGESLDWRSIQVELESSGNFEAVGGIAYIAGLDLDLPTGGLANVEKYAEILRGLWAKRRLIMMAAELSRASLNGKPAEDLISEASATLSDISASSTGADGPRVLQDSLVEFDRWEPRTELLGVTTGLKDLDRMLLGLQTGQAVIGARPSMGKTSFALCIALAAAKAGVPVLFFSLEMPESQLRDRMMAAEPGVSLRSILTGRLSRDEKDRLLAGMRRLGNLPLWVDERPALSADQIAATASVHHMKHGTGLVIVDYLGLVRYVGGKTSEVDQLGEIARSIRETGRRLDIPTVVLHQLNRDPEKRTDKRPTLADLRGSGKIEEHADVVIFLYRDEVYHEDPDNKGLAEIIVAKHRQGEIGMVEAVFTGETTSFKDLARQENPW